MRTILGAWLAVLSLAGAWPAAADGTTADAAAPTLRDHVSYLASERLDGRLTGSEGEALAVDYLTAQLRRIGARPLDGHTDYALGFDFTAGMNDGGSRLVVRVGDDSITYAGTGSVQALSFSDNVTVSGPVVFAGYGLYVPEGQTDYAYDSYVGLDVKDKIVLVLRYFPEDVADARRAALARYASLRYKALRARELGASGVLLVTGPRSPNAGKLVPMTFDTALSGSGIGAASVSGEVARHMFASVEGKTLEQVQAELDSGNPHVAGFDLPGVEVLLDAKVDRETKRAHNVVAELPATVAAADGIGPRGYLALGAHVDHLGHGDHGNSLARKDEVGRIHLGADDNASGVAALLGIAADLASTPRRHPILLAFWSGEELGLLGSSAFLKSGIVPTERIEAYINFDMVGRMKDNRLSLQAAGSSPLWPKLVERLNVLAGFDISLQADPYLPTDATAFYTAGVPTLNFFTGSHEDYHRPTDSADKIDYEDLQRIVEFADRLVGRLDALETPPEYAEVKPSKDQAATRAGVRAFTGTIPDYTTEVNGLRLSGVVAGGPADTAGLREGDVIVEFAGQKITNIYDYTFALEIAKIGQPVTVVIERDGKRVELTLTPTTRN